MPAGVPAAAVAEAGDMPDEDLIRAERMTVWTPGGWPGNPLAVRRLNKLAEHS